MSISDFGLNFYFAFFWILFRNLKSAIRNKLIDYTIIDFRQLFVKVHLT